MYTRTAHSIKHRKTSNDEFSTPIELAKLCISNVPLERGDTVLDPAIGTGAFYNNFPNYVRKLNADRDVLFPLNGIFVDWIITNPPYSNLDTWFERGCQVCQKGFAYLIGLHNLTPHRIEIANKAGFGLVFIYLCKVYEWFGISCFCLFQRGKQNILSYDRKIWR